MKSMFWRAVLLVMILGLLVVSLKMVVGWWRGELSLSDDGNWIWLALSPVSLIIWWRDFSIFGCKEPSCLLPKDDERH